MYDGQRRQQQQDQQRWDEAGGVPEVVEIM